MNHDKEADSGEAPDAADRLPVRRRVRSLPGPRQPSSPPALGPPSPTIESPSESTPVAEVSLSPEYVYVTVELPGAPKDALDIQAIEGTLTVDAPRVGRPAYHLDIELPCPVDPESAEATYRNGILDVTLVRVKTSGGDTHDA